MELNWTIEVIVGFFVSSVILTVVILSYIKLKHFKSKSLSYLRLSFFSASLYFLTEAIGDLFLNLFIGLLYIFIFPIVVISFLIAVTYSRKDSGYSVTLILICLLVPVMVISAFSPDSVEIIVAPIFNYQKIISTGILDLVSIIFYFITGVLGYYWGFLMWLNTPFLYKKEAFLLFLTMM